MNEFLINNIKTKKAFLQNEHKKIIDVLYNNGIKTGTLKGYDYVPHLSQCMTFSDIKEESGFGASLWHRGYALFPSASHWYNASFGCGAGTRL